MLKVNMLYCPYHMKKQYADINEEKILGKIYAAHAGTVEEVISKIINEAVLAHMNLNIDSTIMQMLALNDYLTKLFMNNFNILIYNYCIYYLESKGIHEIEEEKEEKIGEIQKAVNMKTELSDLNILLEKLGEAQI